MQSVFTDCIFAQQKPAIFSQAFIVIIKFPIYYLILHKALVKLCDFLYAGISRVAGTAGIVIG